MSGPRDVRKLTMTSFVCMYFGQKEETGNGAVIRRSLVGVIPFQRVLLTETQTVSYSNDDSCSLLAFVRHMDV